MRPPRSELAFYITVHVGRDYHLLRLSQSVFARVLNVSPATVRGWERGARKPDGPTLRLLELAERQPRALMRNVTRRQARA
jgi:hypothetical protein